jgi:hypothetical protein
MSNIPPLANDSRQAATRPKVRGRIATAAVLMAAAIATLAITSLAQSRDQAIVTQPKIAAQPAAMAAGSMSVPPDAGDLGHFAMGFLVFDWHPAHGVPGFDSWPPRSQR